MECLENCENKGQGCTQEKNVENNLKKNSENHKRDYTSGQSKKCGRTHRI